MQRDVTEQRRPGWRPQHHPREKILLVVRVQTRGQKRTMQYSMEFVSDGQKLFVVPSPPV